MKVQTAARTHLHDWLDRSAIVASGICAVHCLLLPLALAAMPALSRSLDLGEGFHVAVLLIALPVSGVGLVGGWRQHRRFWPLALGSAGLGLMVLALLTPGETLETIVTLCGSLMLATAHVVNWQARRCAYPR